MDKNQQTILELQAKVYEVIKGQYSALDQLVKRMQDDDKGVVPFKQVEGERLALAFALDYFDDIETQIQTLQYQQAPTAEEEHRKEVDEATDKITTEDVVEQAVYMANAPDCCADKHAENMLGMLGANIVDTEIYHDEEDCPRQAVVCNAKFQRKANSIEENPGNAEDGTPCVITDKIELSQNEFEEFAQNLLGDYDFISDHADRYSFGSDGAKCLLVLGEGHNDGILVVTEGFHYARYTSHISNAREMFDLDEIQELGIEECPKLTM